MSNGYFIPCQGKGAVWLRNQDNKKVQWRIEIFFAQNWYQIDAALTKVILRRRWLATSHCPMWESVSGLGRVRIELKIVRFSVQAHLVGRIEGQGWKSSAGRGFRRDDRRIRRNRRLCRWIGDRNAVRFRRHWRRHDDRRHESVIPRWVWKVWRRNGERLCRRKLTEKGKCGDLEGWIGRPAVHLGARLDVEKATRLLTQG